MAEVTQVENVDDDRPRTLFVGNVPKEVTKMEIESIFGDIGRIKRVYLQYPQSERRNDQSKVAYVTYASPDDAVKALDSLEDHRIGNNKLHMKFARTRSEQNREPSYHPNLYQKPRITLNRDTNGSNNPNKEPRAKPINKKARLVIRNLSFQATEEKLRKHFQKFGKIKELNILKKPNGKLVGCAFIQYETVQEAIVALKELSLKPFMKRPIAIDWAVPKAQFQKVKEKEGNGEITQIDISDNSEIKEEDEDEKKVELLDTSEIKQESDDDEYMSGGMNSSRDDSKIKDEDEDEDDEDEDDDDEDEKKPFFEAPKKFISNDASEGKTLFIRNLEFETSEENLKEFFTKYGEMKYALIVKDKLTEHPKGSAFIKFMDSDSSEACMKDFKDNPSEFMFGRRQIIISMALSKDNLNDRVQETKKKEAKDNRNLYLSREGFIRPGSGAAEGVSASDMTKRGLINRSKKQMIKNLNTFFSRTRLCIHNLPENYDDKKLRDLFKQHSPKGAKVIEAKVMRDMNEADLNGVGKSKGFGFISFTEHDHALETLRLLNNNPSIFNPNHRPIVEFSLENRAALKAKQKREEKSKEMLKRKLAEQEEAAAEPKKKKIKKVKKGKDGEEKKRTPDFTGLEAKSGLTTFPGLKPKKGKKKITRNSLKKTKKDKISRKQKIMKKKRAA